jgi:polysaccharide biosynthesis transport protein
LELSGYLETARRWWWTLLIATWVAGLAGYIVATRIPPTYEGRSTLLVGPIQGDLNTLRASGQLALTYAELVTVKPRLEAALKQVGDTTLSPSEFGAATRVTANDTNRTLTIRVQDGSPETAAKLSNTLAGLLTQLVEEGTGRPEGELQILEFAEPPTSPVAPQVPLIVLLSAFVGLLSSLVFVVLLEYIGATVRSREDITRLVPVPFLGQIEGSRTPRSAGLVVDSMPASRMASSYRIVATRIVFAESEIPLKSVLVVGAQPSDGTGETAANLATALATAGRRTILIDGDDIVGDASAVFGLDRSPGLAEVVSGQIPLIEAIVRHGPELDVLPVGITAVDRVDDSVMRRIVSDLLKDHELVIVAGPPTLGSAESLVYARATDASVVVVDRDQTKRAALAHAVESLTLVGAEVLGVVLDARSGRSARRERTRVGTRPAPAPVRPVQETGSSTTMRSGRGTRSTGSRRESSRTVD